MTTTKKPQQELLQSQTNVEEANRENYSEPLITHKLIEGTPFRITGNNEKGYTIIFGRYKLTTPKETIEEAETEFENEKYNLLLKMMIIVIEQHEEIKKEITKNKS